MDEKIYQRYLQALQDADTEATEDLECADELLDRILLEAEVM